MVKALLRFVCVFLCVFESARADIQWVNFSFQFGTSTLDVDGSTTRGSGWSATTEIYTAEDSGYLLNVGSSTTSATDVDYFGTEVERIQVQNRYLQPGAFFFPMEGLRLAAGPSLNWIEQEIEYSDDSEEDESREFAGPFFNVSYRLPIEKLVLGAQFNYVSFGEYTQSDLFFLVGASF